MSGLLRCSDDPTRTPGRAKVTGPVQTTEEFVDVGTHRLEVIRIEPQIAGGGQPLVFLHEGLGSARLWRDFPARVADATRRSAIVYSRAGYGRSSTIVRPRPVGYMHHEANDVLPALLERLGVTSPVLIGHSDGASIALIHAAVTPTVVSALVVMAPHVFVEPISLQGVRAARAAALDGPLLERLARHHDDADAAFWGWNDAWLDPAFAAWDICAGLSCITAPVLAIQGSDDDYATMAQLRAIAGAVADVRTLELGQCGHSPWRDQPETVLESITEFLGRDF